MGKSKVLLLSLLFITPFTVLGEPLEEYPDTYGEVRKHLQGPGAKDMPKSISGRPVAVYQFNKPALPLFHYYHPEHGGTQTPFSAKLAPQALRNAPQQVQDTVRANKLTLRSVNVVFQLKGEKYDQELGRGQLLYRPQYFFTPDAKNTNAAPYNVNTPLLWRLVSPYGDQLMPDIDQDKFAGGLPKSPTGMSNSAASFHNSTNKEGKVTNPKVVASGNSMKLQLPHDRDIEDFWSIVADRRDLTKSAVTLHWLINPELFKEIQNGSRLSRTSEEFIHSLEGIVPRDALNRFKALLGPFPEDAFLSGSSGKASSLSSAPVSVPSDFDADIYLSLYEDLWKAAEKLAGQARIDWAKRHYVKRGIKEDRKYRASEELLREDASLGSPGKASSSSSAPVSVPSDFDGNTYISRHKDLYKVAKNLKGQAREDWAKRHYMKHGTKEGRSYTPPSIPDGFIEEVYLSLHPDLLRVANEKPLTEQGRKDWARRHYINHGFREGRRFLPR